MASPYKLFPDWRAVLEEPRRNKGVLPAHVFPSCTHLAQGPEIYIKLYIWVLFVRFSRRALDRNEGCFLHFRIYCS